MMRRPQATMDFCTIEKVYSKIHPKELKKNTN
jgi:hypothetical protein